MSNSSSSSSSWCTTSDSDSSSFHFFAPSPQRRSTSDDNNNNTSSSAEDEDQSDSSSLNNQVTFSSHDEAEEDDSEGERQSALSLTGSGTPLSPPSSDSSLSDSSSDDSSSDDSSAIMSSARASQGGGAGVRTRRAGQSRNIVAPSRLIASTTASVTRPHGRPPTATRGARRVATAPRQPTIRQTTQTHGRVPAVITNTTTATTTATATRNMATPSTSTNVPGILATAIGAIRNFRAPAVSTSRPPGPPSTEINHPPAKTATVPQQQGVHVPNMNATFNNAYFECVVCLENLDSAATILEPNLPNNNDAIIALAAHGNPPGVDVVQIPVADRRRDTAASKKERALAEIDPREICTTSCGHLYHKYCIQKWFHEQGRRTCPSCRKNVGSKTIRLFPNVGQDIPTAKENPVPAASIDQPTASGSKGTRGEGAVADLPMSLQVQRNRCTAPACVDLHTIHETLVGDYNQLRELYNGARDDLELRTAEMASLQDHNNNLTRELDELKATVANNEQGAAKRRRRR